MWRVPVVKEWNDFELMMMLMLMAAVVNRVQTEKQDYGMNTTNVSLKNKIDGTLLLLLLLLPRTE